MDRTVYFFISRVLWFIPPIRQYKSRYFLFFLSLTLMDLSSMFIRNVLHSSTNIHYIVLNLFSIFSVFSFQQLKKNVIWAVALSLFFLLVVLFKTDVIFDIYLLLISQMILLAVMLKRTTLQIIEDKIINLFYVVFILYFMLQLTRLFNVVLYFADATYFYELTTIIDYGIAVFFIVFREDSKKIIFPVKFLEKLESGI